MKKTFFGRFFTVIKEIVKQKILLRTPYILKVRDPTFLRPEFDVRRPSLKVEKF